MQHCLSGYHLSHSNVSFQTSPSLLHSSNLAYPSITWHTPPLPLTCSSLSHQLCRINTSRVPFTTYHTVYRDSLQELSSVIRILFSPQLPVCSPGSVFLSAPFGLIVYFWRRCPFSWTLPLCSPPSDSAWLSVRLPCWFCLTGLVVCAQLASVYHCSEPICL